MELEQRRDMSYLRPTVTTEYTEIDLKITYLNSLKLKIYHKTNKMWCSDSLALVEYLKEHKIFLHSTCDHCMTTIESQFLEFNLAHGYVMAVGLAREHLLVNGGDKLYFISSAFLEEKSIITVTHLDRTKPLTPFTIETPLIPLYKLKTKDRMIDKIKTYMIFS
jgi:hypothetical protein